MVDWHVHTTASDGDLTPREVVRKAARDGVTDLAITDHDTQDGVEEAREEGERLRIRVVPGVELSCCPPGIHNAMKSTSTNTGHDALIWLKEQGADLDAKDNYGRTPLRLARESRNMLAHFRPFRPEEQRMASAASIKTGLDS